MSEPEIVPCPTCGGPCKKPDSLKYDTRFGSWDRFESLVKGEVVEAWAIVPGIRGGKAAEFWIYTGDRPLDAELESFRVLMIRKETGGKE